MEKVYTTIGTPNIAFVKYWGRRNDSKNLPANSSISMTLDEKLNTRTSVLLSKKLNEDRFFLNGKQENLEGKNASEKSRLIKAALDSMRSAADSKEHALIVSENSFPTSAGLASSASGAAALIYCLNSALDLKMDTKQQSIIARQISGSACRSIFGGIVKWQKGSRNDGADSYAEQVVAPKHWPELIDIIAVVDSKSKKVSSSEGHTLTPRTSRLYRLRPEIAELSVDMVESAVKKKDFKILAEVIIRDSNNMHATMLDTYPPIIYLNDVSSDIIYNVHEMNVANGIVAAYTFDAGPNAHIITLKKSSKEIIKRMNGIKGIKEFIVSGQGDGPRMLPDSGSLIDMKRMAPMIRAQRR